MLLKSFFFVLSPLLQWIPSPQRGTVPKFSPVSLWRQPRTGRCTTSFPSAAYSPSTVWQWQQTVPGVFVLKTTCSAEPAGPSPILEAGLEISHISKYVSTADDYQGTQVKVQALCCPWLLLLFLTQVMRFGGQRCCGAG